MLVFKSIQGLTLKNVHPQYEKKKIIYRVNSASSMNVARKYVK